MEITIKVGEEEVKVSKDVLLSSSKVFEVMFTCGMRYLPFFYF